MNILSLTSEISHRPIGIEYNSQQYVQPMISRQVEPVVPQLPISSVGASTPTSSTTSMASGGPQQHS